MSLGGARAECGLTTSPCTRSSRAIRCLVTAAAHVGQMSSVLRACISHHAHVLGLRIVSDVGRLRVAPLPGADARILTAAGKASAISGLNPHQGFDPAADEGHALRIAARVKALASVQTTLFDTEGLGNIDLEVQSDAAWKSWCRALEPDDRTALNSLEGRSC